MRSWRWDPYDGIGALLKVTREIVLPLSLPPEDTVKKQPLQTKKQALIGTQPGTDLRFPNLQNCEK